MSLNFYSKDNKIIVNNSGNPILCDKCPCETDDVYYAIIGFRMQSTSYENPTQISDKCNYNYKVEVKKVINGKILVQFGSTFPSWGRPEHNMIWMDITKNLGFCGSGNGYYNNWYHVEAFNISDKIYTDLDQFKEYFWSGCGVQPTDGVYPDIWDVYTYDGKEVDKMKNGAGEATTCIGNYWNTVFTDKYLPSYNITYTQLCQSWKIYVQSVRYHYNQMCDCFDETYSWCGTPDPYPDGDCNQPGCTNKQCYPGYPEYIQACGQYLYKEPYTTSGQIWFDLVPGGPEYYYEGMIPCWDINSIGNTTNINNVLYNKIRDKSQYIWWHSYSYDWPGGDRQSSAQNTQSCNLGSPLCISNHYWSGLVRAHQDVGNYWQYLFRWGKLDLTRNQYTPSSAIGVKFDAVITKRVLLYPNTDTNNPNLSSVILSGQINLYFDQTYEDLPLITDIPLTNIVQRPTCTDANCQNCEGYLNISPFAIAQDSEKHVTHPSGWIKQQGIYFNFVGKEYIFNNN